MVGNWPLRYYLEHRYCARRLEPRWSIVAQLLYVIESAFKSSFPAWKATPELCSPTILFSTNRSFIPLWRKSFESSRSVGGGFLNYLDFKKSLCYRLSRKWVVRFNDEAGWGQTKKTTLIGRFKKEACLRDSVLSCRVPRHDTAVGINQAAW